MRTPRRGPAVLLSLVVCAGLAAACGKKGPPLAPLARVPSPPANPQAARVGDDVYVWFTVPSANVSGQSPADVSAIELYALTATEAPSGEDLTEAAVKIGTYAVQPVLPPPPPVPEGAPAPKAIPLPPGFAQGAVAVVREPLSPDLRAATVLPVKAREPEPLADEALAPLPGPLVAPGDATALRRFYFAVAVGPRNRKSAPSQVVSVPVDDASGSPTDLRIDYTEAGMTLAWAAPANARRAPGEPDPGLLPSKPLVPLPPPTGYHVFEVPRAEAPAPDPYSLALPAPLTPQPMATTEFAVPGPVRYGEERCFVVRATDTLAGAVVVGPASIPACVTPVDTFPPAPPKQLAAIAGVGVINLIWEPNAEADLAGYIVLRGVAPGETLQAITPTPIRETTYRDESATPGVRYTYAVVAVDTASPQNVSGQSNRVEETSRTP